MKSRLYKSLLVLLLWFYAVAPSPARADGAVVALDPVLERQIEAAARAFDADYLLTRNTLRQLGFPPAGAEWESVSAWPLERQLEAAYLSAEEARKGSGEELLRSVVRRMAGWNDAVRHDDDLRRFFHDSPEAPLVDEPPPRLEFRRPSPERLAAGVPETVSRVIEAVGRHATHFPGGLPALSARCCRLDGKDAHRRLLRSDSVRGFLADVVMRSVVPPDLAQKLVRLLQDTVRFDANLIEDPRLAEYRSVLEEVLRRPNETGRMKLAELVRESLPVVADPNGLVEAIGKEVAAVAPARAASAAAEKPALTTLLAEATGRDLVGPARDAALGADNPFAVPGGGGGGRPTFSDMRYRSFEHANYGPPSTTLTAAERRRFADVRADSGGWGGVVFGNDVTADPSVPAPVALTWQPLEPADGSSAESSGPVLDPKTPGVFVFLLADGSRALSPASAEDAAAAATIVFDGIPGVREPWQPGEAIGLVGSRGLVRHYSLQNGELVVSDDQPGLSFVVHPALANRGLGQAAIMVDALPSIGRSLMEYMLRAGGAIDQLHKLKAWLDKGDEWNAYKITDVKLRVTRPRLALLDVIRQSEDDDAATWPEQLLRNSFLSFHGFDRETNERQPESADFYRLLPALTAVSTDYARLNAFARTLALLRWARVNGTAWLGAARAREAALAWGTLFLTGQDAGSRTAPDTAPPKIIFGPEPFELARFVAMMVDEKARDLFPPDTPKELVSLNDRVLENRLRRIGLGAVFGLLIQKGLIAKYGVQNDDRVLGKLAEKFERLQTEDPIADDEERLIAKIIMVNDGLKRDAIPIDSRLKELRVRQASINKLVQQLEQIKFVRMWLRSSANLGLRWQLAPEAVKAATKADLDAWLHATEVNQSAFWRTVRLWWALPLPWPYLVEAELEKGERELAAISDREAQLEAQKRALIPGFDAWYKLQVSYREACPTGICM